MSAERWIEIGDHDHFVNFGIAAAQRWHEAADQRVKNLRWCETHGSRFIGEKRTLGPFCQAKASGHYKPFDPDCIFVDAVLILPPEGEAA